MILRRYVCSKYMKNKEDTIVTILIIISILALIFRLDYIYQEKARTKRIRTWIREHYGSKPEKKNYNWKNISYYWSEYSKVIPNDEKIDEVTWNDLEMNEIFGRMNGCTSFIGEQVLYFTLHTMRKNETSSQILNEKIDYFSKNEKEREEIQYLLSRLGKEEDSYYFPRFINNMDAFRISDIWKYRILQFVYILSFLPAIIYKNPMLLVLSFCVLILNSIVYNIIKAKYEIILNSLNDMINIINISKHISNLKRLSYESEFHHIQDKLELFKKIPHMFRGMKRSKAASMSGQFETIIIDYIIGSTLIDVLKYNRVMEFLKQEKENFMALYHTIGEIDMAIAITSFRNSIPFYCNPNFSDNHELIMEQIYHPLIDAPISNTITLNRNCIVTGSNASGKSTFIKAIAVNVILAHSIYTCMAKEMILPRSWVITSMAVRDDLMSGESYYIKEIKYLNRIIQNLNEDRMVICVIDEILRGTNTQERIAASTAILKYLDKKNCIAIVASHDIELTKILSDCYDNYHFREQIMNQDIFFDYIIHEGASTSKNAIKLLEFVHFPEEIVNDARKQISII